MVCDTVEEFYKYYSAMKPCSRMFNEVINCEWHAQKFKLDIDGRINNIELQYVIKVIRRIFRKLTKVCKPDILVYDISTSYHIIVTNICFSTSSCCEMIANAISDMVERKYPIVSSLIDVGVYKKVQMFRVEASTKYGQTRWKYVSGMGDLSPLDMFKKGIITYTDECHTLDADIVVDVIVDMGIYTHETTRHKKSRVVNVPKEFVVRKIVNNMTVLNRIYPSHCDTCMRVHENENAYMIGNKLYCGRVYF